MLTSPERDDPDPQQWKALAAGTTRTGEYAEVRLLIDPLIAGDLAIKQAIQEAIFAEWGSQAPPDMFVMERFIKDMGGQVFVLISECDAKAVLWTKRLALNGKAKALVNMYKSLNALAWDGINKRFDELKGDTVALLAITNIGEPRHGYGALLRDLVVRMLPKEIKACLTITPAADDFDIKNTANYHGGAAFHYRAGARAQLVEPLYRAFDPFSSYLEKGNQHYADAVIFKYDLVELRAHWAGQPVPRRVSWPHFAWALSPVHLPSVHSPAVQLPSVGGWLSRQGHSVSSFFTRRWH